MDRDFIQCSPNRDIASKTEVLRLENLVRTWVVQDRLGVNTSLVGECTVTTLNK